jgi:hypothetical protein
MTLDEQIAMIDALPPPEREGFGLVCTNMDKEVPPDILRALLRKGLIIKVPGYGYDVVSYWVHYAWCEWCCRQEANPHD